MKILVTGCCGFIGSHLCDHLVAQGHDVAGVDDMSNAAVRSLDPKVRLYRHNILLPGLRKILGTEKPDAVCHLAGVTSVVESADDPVRYLEVNLLGTVKLLEAMRHEGLDHIVYASSGGTIYGDLKHCTSKTQFFEHDEPLPMSHYGASKHHVEHHLRAYYMLHQIRWAALRLANVYGPRQRIGFVPEIARLMLDKRPVRMRGDGSQVRDWVYVHDVARAFALACLKGGGVVNVGSGKGACVMRMFETLAKIIGYTDPPEWKALGPGEVNESVLNCDHAEVMLGWKAETSLEDGLRATVESMR